MSSRAFMKVTKSGRFRTGGELHRALAQHVGPILRRAGLVLQGGIQDVAPVVTGNLRRTTTTDDPEWRGSVYLVKVGPRAVYARRVNATSRKNRGFVKRGVDASKGKARAELRRGIEGLGLPAIWESQ